jgi:hypothetical protein
MHRGHRDTGEHAQGDPGEHAGHRGACARQHVCVQLCVLLHLGPPPGAITLPRGDHTPRGRSHSPGARHCSRLGGAALSRPCTWWRRLAGTHACALCGSPLERRQHLQGPCGRQDTAAGGGGCARRATHRPAGCKGLQPQPSVRYSCNPTHCSQYSCNPTHCSQYSCNPTHCSQYSCNPVLTRAEVSALQPELQEALAAAPSRVWHKKP